MYSAFSTDKLNYNLFVILGSIGRQLVPGLLLVDNGTDNKVISGPSVQVVAEELRGQQQPQSTGVSPKDQLKYLAQLLNFEVQFSDFPKVFTLSINFLYSI